MINTKSSSALEKARAGNIEIKSLLYKAIVHLSRILNVVGTRDPGNSIRQSSIAKRR
jgi:hypothetical protein